jgi:hypothetical protein
LREVFDAKTIFDLTEINPLIVRYKTPLMFANDKVNGYVFSKEVLNSIIPSIKGTAVITYYDKEINKFSGHKGDLYRGKTGFKRTPETFPVGFSAYDENSVFWETLNLDGTEREWLCATTYLWKNLYPYVDDLQNKVANQSVQIDVNYKEKDGVKYVTDAQVEAITLIGIKPAFSGSSFQNFSKDDFTNDLDNLKQELISFSKYSTVNFSIPEDIKNISNRTLGEDKLTSVCKDNLNYLNYNDYITPEKVSYIKSYFSRNKSVQEKDVIINWCNELELQMGEIDKGCFSLNNNEQLKEDGDKAKMTNKKRTEFSEKYSMTVDQIKDMMNDMCSSQKYTTDDGERNRFWVYTFDSDYMYGYDNQMDCNMAIPFTISDDGQLSADFENVKKAKQMSIWLVENNEDYEEADDEDTYHMNMMMKTKQDDMEKHHNEMEVKMGQQFASITSLESALADEKTISENRLKEIEELSAKLKASENKDKIDKVNALMSKKEFKVFSAEDKQEIVNMSSDNSYEVVEKEAYAKLGRFASNNISFDENGKFSFMFVGNESKDNNNENKDDPNDAYAKARKKYGAKNKNNMNESDGVK